MPLDLAALLPQFDREVRLGVTYPGTEKETLTDAAGAPRLVRFTRPAPGHSFVLYQNFSPAEADAEIAAQLRYFTERNLPWDWKVYAHDTPADMPQRLAAHGFVPEDPDAVMCLDLDHAPAALLAPPRAAAVSADLHPITTRAQLADVVTVMEAVWGGNFNWVYDRLGSHLEIPGYLEIYAAYVDGQPASAAWIYFPPNTVFAGLWGGSTLSAYRSRGLYTALLAQRVQSARRRGYRYLTIDASPMSRPIVAKHGFEQLTTAYGFDAPAAGRSPGA